MYNHQLIEKKWQNYWESMQIFRTPELHEKTIDGKPISQQKKFYTLDMFPYPSGAGLHVGHPVGYIANDIISRYKHARGYNVLHPMGWDAFGLPAENYAIKTGIHPSIITQQNIKTFKQQIQSFGLSYDWSREINTTDSEYYKWTQWIFLKLFENGLAYEQDLPVNWCPALKAVLANEEVINGRSEIGDHPVERKKLRQWVLAITKYADRLLTDVDNLDWPEGIKDMQRNWIGKSEGCEFEMKKSDDTTKSIRVYTTRIDTVFGVTYAVIAPDHPSVHDFIIDAQRKSCEAYIYNASKQSDQDRIADNKEKTGVFTGSYVINPYNNQEVPLWIADYVLGSYGAGAVMAVPAHDERDFEFAKKYDLEIRQSIAPYITMDGISTPKSDENIFKFICTTAIIKHPSDEKFILLRFQKTGEYGFVGGGLEDGEKFEEAITREVIEETGYKNHNIEEILFDISYSRGYKGRKNREEEAKEKIFVIKLKDLEQEVKDCDEHDSVFWLTKEEILSKISLKHHKFFFEQYLKTNKAYCNNGVLIHSGKYDGLSSQEAKKVLTEYAESTGFGHKKVNYKLRDWLFSRQRYWGEPIPLIHLEPSDVEKLPRTPSQSAWIKDENILMVGEKEFSKIYDGIYTKIVCDYNLPLKLPEVEKYEPSGDGQSPLANIHEFINVTLADNLKGKREANTMPQWGGSCWYYLRFMDPKNFDTLVSKEVESYWGSVDSYVGGAEHAVLHLLYARFWHKFLYDIGVVSTIEPFYRLRNQGMVLGMSYKTHEGRLIANDAIREEKGKYFSIETGEELQKMPAKMSKSLKNVINPDDIIREYGADTLRLYEMYMGDFTDSKPWDTTAIVGCRRFLDKVYNLYIEEKERFSKNDETAMKTLHKTIKKVGEDIENYKFNTAIAQMMICLNEGIPQDIDKKIQWKQSFIHLLHPFAPHLAEECWEKIYIGHASNTQQKIYYATKNQEKIKRAQDIFDAGDDNFVLEQIPDFVEIEEKADNPLDCALQKLAPYQNKGYEVPVMTADTAVYFENQDFEPTKVRRSAIEFSGKNESQLTKEEIATLMIDFYKNIADKNGGEIDFYYVDAFAVLFPDGEIKTQQYRRYYALTNVLKGDIYVDMPMRNLYISKITGKRADESTKQDYLREFQDQLFAFSQLFNMEKKSIFFTGWPDYNPSMTIDNEITIGVQVLGKLRGEICIDIEEDKDSVLAKAKNNPDIVKWIEDKEIIKEIYIPGKIVNIVVK